MFTGIVEEIGTVRGTSPELTIEANKVLQGTKVGDSIGVNGVCLTVLFLSDHSFSVDIMPETLRRSNLGRLHYGDKVNLERALMVGGRLGGHLVLAHIDGTGEVMSVTPEENAYIMRISAPAELMPYIVNKGFIAVEGASLTISCFNDFSFSVSLANYTLEHTTLGEKRPGDVVNLEADIIAKYVERLKGQEGRGLTSDLLYSFSHSSIDPKV
ncbi:MAG: riboflavin synthase [Chloroflexota bacterium]|nr:riboflavin synthase [Chloroflexota bacterium]